MLENMKKLRFYVETSVWNFLFAEDDPKKRRITEAFFEAATGEPYDLYISPLVLKGIEEIKDEAKKRARLEAVQKYAPKVLEERPEVERLADKLIAEAVIPRKYLNAARHLAYGYVHDMDVLVSWNQKHIVKLKTRLLAGAIAQMEGYKPIEICTPEEVSDNG